MDWVVVGACDVAELEWVNLNIQVQENLLPDEEQ
jgi:hypothetical protein